MEHSTRRCTTSNSRICTLVKGKIEKPDVAERTPRNPRVSISISQICECVCWKNVNVTLSPKQHESDDQIQNLLAMSNHRSIFLTDIYVSCHHWKFETTRRRFRNSQFQHVDKCLHWLGINHCHQRTWWSSIFRPCEFGNQDLSILLFRFRVTHSMLALEKKKGWSHHLISLTPRSVSKGYQKHLFVGPMEIQNYCAMKKSHMWALHWSTKKSCSTRSELLELSCNFHLLVFLEKASRSTNASWIPVWSETMSTWAIMVASIPPLKTMQTKGRY